MGYRSDVVVAFYPAPKDSEFRVDFSLIKLWFEENYPQGWGDVDCDEEREIITIRYESTNWYDGYSEVQEVNNAIEKFKETFKCEESDGHATCEFVRIGEDYNDIEVERTAYHDFRLDIERRIVIN